MPDVVTVRLYDTAAAGTARVAIELNGSRPGPGGDVTVASATVTSPAGVQKFPTAGTVGPLIPATYIDDSAGVNALQLKAGTAVQTITIGLAYTPDPITKAVAFLDRSFQTSSGAEFTLELRLPGSSPPTVMPAWIVLTVRGAVSAASGSTTFASAAMGFRIEIAGPPSFPSSPLGAIDLELPGEIPWPPLQIPWPDFPKLPSFPLQLPGLSQALDLLPVQLAFKGVSLNLDASGILTMHVEGIDLCGIGGVLSGSIDLTFQVQTVPKLVLNFPSLGTITSSDFKPLSDGCFGMDWSGSPISPLLRLVSSEVVPVADSSDNSMQLRLHAPGLELEEARLDWTFATSRQFTLPGFQVSVPAPRMFSLIAHHANNKADDGPFRLTLAATFVASSSLTISSTFAWPLSDSDREMHRDASGQNSDSLISLTATARNAVSVVLFDLPIGPGDSPRFLQQLKVPLATLTDLESGAGADDPSDNNNYVKGLLDPCPTTPVELTPLSLKDWMLQLTLNASSFTLPFLNLGDSQFVKIISITPTICTMSADHPNVGEKFRLTVNNTPHDIELGSSSNQTLEALSAAINALASSVQASIYIATSVKRLVLTPASGTTVLLEQLTSKTYADFCPALGFECQVGISVGIVDGVTLATTVGLLFDPARMAFLVDLTRGLWLTMPGPYPAPGTDAPSFYGLGIRFTPTTADVKQSDQSVIPKGAIFNLAVAGGNYSIRQAPGSVITLEYDRCTMPGEPILFQLTDLAITPKGVNLTAKITDQPARFNGLETQFRFTTGEIQVVENQVKGFTIGGNGPLPPALIDNASADVFLQFGQASDGGAVRLQRGSARVKGSNLLSCHLTRFDFSLDGMGLEFVDDKGADHLYFTLSGKARYAPASGDDPSGPLAWMPSIEIQLVDCPLTGNMSVLAQHVKFLVELPKKVTFSLLGCFNMEIRAIGFLPQFDKLRATADPGSDPTSAMQVSGQIYFAETGDVIEVEVDFHDLIIALPARGEDLPRLYCKGLGLTIKQGDSFELSGEVDFFNDEQIDTNVDGSPIYGSGFAGSGSVLIQGLPKLTATFAFMRVSLDGKTDWKRAWFLYLEADEMSIQIPVVEIFIREIGMGFGYRYTLAAIKASDDVNDVRKLLKTLKQLALTQGNLSRRDQWRVDLENPGEGARWTVALRAMISESSAQAGPFGDYDEVTEAELSCMFLFDVVIALRSDMTFLMAGRAWIDTNYVDYHTSHDNNTSLQNNPLFAAFVLLSPRQKRFLANLSSNPNAEYGNHPELPFFLQQALKSAQFTATLLVEPDLFHLELGWPNQLKWDGDLGPLQVEINGGAIFRVSKTELVVGNSFMARGTLDVSAGFDAGFMGASLSAFAQVAYGARYIGVLSFGNTSRSAFYGAIGLEIHVTVSIDFWIKIPVFIGSIKLNFSFSFAINFTAALEVGITLKPETGIRGSATIGLSLMGHSVQFDVRIGILDNVVDDALACTNPFLNVGLEATSVDPVPGTQGSSTTRALPLSQHVALAALHAPALHASALLTPGSPALALVSAPAVAASGINPPQGYTLVAIEVPNTGGSAATVYYLLVPEAADEGEAQSFFAPPPNDGITPTSDFAWTVPTAPAGVTIQQLTPTTAAAVTPGTPFSWTAAWSNPLPALSGASTAADSSTWNGHWVQLLPASSVDQLPTTGTKLTTLTTINDLLYIRTFDANGTIIFNCNEKDATSTTTKPLMNALKAAIATMSPPFTVAQVNQVVTLVRKLMGSDYVYDIGEFFRHAYLCANDPNNIVPIADPKVVGTTGAALSDPRVQSPDADAYDAAVQGAMAQVSAPFFKFDEQSTYDGSMKKAFSRNTTIYDDSGNVTASNAAAVDDTRRAVQLRGSIMHKMLRDVQQYAALDDGSGTLSGDMKSLRSQSLAFALGVVFKATGPEATTGNLGVRWLETGGGTIKQRKGLTSTAVDSDPIPVSQYNPRNRNFANAPPSFAMIRKFEHAEMIGIAWELQWDGAEDLEHHLSYYQVSRVHLNGRDPAGVFQVKKGVVLHNDNGNSMTLQPRFQLIDRFDGATDIAALTENGKVYLYTITPMDLAGNASPRPLSLTATRLPMDPPSVPSDGELVLSYELSDQRSDWPSLDTGRPRIRKPTLITFQWSDPLPAPGTSPPAVASYRLVFRRENALPIGFFGADADTRGGRAAGFPVTNARTLRTDRVLPILRSSRSNVIDPTTNQPVRADSGRIVQQVTIQMADLVTLGVQEADGTWQPDAWRIFVQAVAPPRGGGLAGDQIEGVPSALAAVTVRYHFAPAGKTSPYEERTIGWLEWIPDPVRFDLLPPEDETLRSGFAQVPMPGLVNGVWTYPIDTPINGTLPGLNFEAHPERIRALQMTWNQGPSANSNHPLDLHAKHQLFEFDVEAKTSEALAECTAVSVTPSGVKAGDSFTLTIGDSVITVTATADGTANVTAGLAAAWQHSTDPAVAAIAAEDETAWLSLAVKSPSDRFTVTGQATSADQTHTPALTITQHLSTWQTNAGLRLLQEVELMPAEDLPLNPADASNPVAWDVWTPATSRRILLRRKMIADGTWPAKTDATQLGPWFSWRDSFLDWPPPIAAQPFKKSNRLLWPFHELFRGVFERLLHLPDGPRAPGSSWPLQRFSLELSSGMTRATTKPDPRNPSAPPLASAPGGGQIKNPYPDPNNPPKLPNPHATANTPIAPSPFAAFLLANPADSDPHGWGLLDRMGLAVTFRIRERLTGNYVLNGDQAELVRWLLAALQATPVFLTVNAGKTLNPGDAVTLNITAVDDKVSYILLDGSNEFDNTSLALPTPVPVNKGGTAPILTILPQPDTAVLWYWGNATLTDPNGIVTVIPKPKDYSDALTYLFVESLFQPGARTALGPNDLTSGSSVSTGGLLALSRLSLRPKVRQRMRYQAFVIHGMVNGKWVVAPGTAFQVVLNSSNADGWYMLQSGTPGIPNPLPTGQTVTIQPVMPKEGQVVILVQGVFDSTTSVVNITATDSTGANSLSVTGPTAFAPTDFQAMYFAAVSAKAAPSPNNAPPWAVAANPPEKQGWDRFTVYLKTIRYDLVPLPDPTSDDMPNLLSWLDRFFEEGGDVAPLNTGDLPASTLPGPWVSAAYPRTSTPMALTPDAAGRITYYQLIQDLWGHTYRFFLRPQGRYDLLWAALSQSAIFTSDNGRGVVAQQQAQIVPPAPGGMDVVLDRIRPLAAPLVLSSRRLDAPSPPGQAVPPGTIWEVLIAKHPEQALIEKNRSLVNHLGYRQVAHTLARSIADPQALADLRTTLSCAVSSVIEGTLLPQNSYKLTVGVFTKSIDIDPPQVSKLVDAINHLGWPVTAALVQVQVTGPTEIRLVLTPTTTLPPIAGDVMVLSPLPAGGGALPTTGNNLLIIAFVGGVLHLRAFDTTGTMILDIDETQLANQAPDVAALKATVAALEPPHTLTGSEKNSLLATVTGLVWQTPPLRLSMVAGSVETQLTSETVNLTDERFELPVNSRPPDSRRPEQLPLPGLPAPPTSLDQLDLSTIAGDDLLSIDLPLRPVDFDQGVVAVQWRSLPFYYRYKLLLIAQSSAVVSPITSLDQRDQHYITPLSSATMQGVATADGKGRRRKIKIRLARYWDCLDAPAQAAWGIEEPASVGNHDPSSYNRRLSSLPDPAVIYQLIIKQPSCNIQIVAEYIHDPTEVSGYKSRVLPGPFRGDSIRALPPADGPGVGSKDVYLETLLTPVAGDGPAVVIEIPISSRASFAGATAAGVVVMFPPDVPLTACALRLAGTLTTGQITDLAALIKNADPTFANPLLQLLDQPGPDRYAEACVGFEQLGEIQTGVILDATGRQITWPGEITSAQQDMLASWIKSSLFATTFTNLQTALANQSLTCGYAADAHNPVQTDTTLPATRLQITPSGLQWFSRLTKPALATEVAALTTLQSKPGLPAPVVAALTALLADLAAPSTLTTTVAIAETFWKPRPTQATLPASLQSVMLIGHGATGFSGLMTLAEGRALQELSGLTAPDQDAVSRLFIASLQSGLNGGTLTLRTRRGSADLQEATIKGDLTQVDN